MSVKDPSQHLGSRAAAIKLSGVPSLGAEAAFDFLGVRSRSKLCHLFGASSIWHRQRQHWH